MFPGGSRTVSMTYTTVRHVSWVGYMVQYTGPAQHLTTAGQDLAGLDRDLSDL